MSSGLRLNHKKRGRCKRHRFRRHPQRPPLSTASTLSGGFVRGRLRPYLNLKPHSEWKPILDDEELHDTITFFLQALDQLDDLFFQHKVGVRTTRDGAVVFAENEILKNNRGRREARLSTSDVKTFDLAEVDLAHQFDQTPPVGRKIANLCGMFHRLHSPVSCEARSLTRPMSSLSCRSKMCLLLIFQLPFMPLSPVLCDCLSMAINASVYHHFTYLRKPTQARFLGVKSNIM